MFNSTEDKIKEVQKKIILMSVLDTPGMLMLALWAYGKFGSKGEPLHPLLASETVLTVLLLAGLAIVILCAIQIVSLSLKKAELQKQLAQESHAG